LGAAGLEIALEALALGLCDLSGVAGALGAVDEDDDLVALGAYVVVGAAVKADDQARDGLEAVLELEQRDARDDAVVDDVREALGGELAVGDIDEQTQGIVELEDRERRDLRA